LASGLTSQTILNKKVFENTLDNWDTALNIYQVSLWKHKSSVSDMGVGLDESR
jgi:hypothetical protein